ncbi:MAG: tetratricopeptide repeat protein [Terriglobales bacterium]
MRTRLLILLALVLSTMVAAQNHSAHAQSKPTTLMSGLGDLHHPVSTSNQMAQRFFDQGLRLIYAFNHEEAARSFQRAADLDPNLAIAYWGVAEAVGPNYNDPAGDERFAAAHQAIQKAVDLSSHALPAERAYIHAMALRFPADPAADRRQAAEAYHDAMRELTKNFPDDPDAATLFAESGMTLNPWGLWHLDGTPAAGTEEIVATLESVIKRYPNHMGAIHYYIHTVEASASPERALAAANRLAAMAPAAGHLVHMPAHVYIRTGDYAAAVKTNYLAAAADRAYIKASGEQGLYPMMYYSHNLHFIAICAAMDGDYAEAIQGARMLADHVRPHVKDMPPLEGFLTIPIAVDVRFHKWDELLRMPKPDAALQTETVFWHFAHGMALAGKGKPDEARADYQAVAEAEKNTPEDAIFAPPVTNKTQDILKIARDILGAKIALAKKDNAAAIALLQSAVALQDSLKYNEPEDWFFPVRESLGAVMLMNGDAVGAEKVFREDLDRHPRNPRSLFGLAQALKMQKRDYDAGYVQKQLQEAWKGSLPLKVEDLV